MLHDGMAGGSSSAATQDDRDRRMICWLLLRGFPQIYFINKTKH
jgi:hypothetical protein